MEEHILKDYADFERLEVTDPYKNPVLAPILESAKRLKDRFPDVSMTTSVAGPISTAVSYTHLDVYKRQDAMYAGIEEFQKYLPEAANTSIGKIAIGVVEGDTHDIGKNLVKICLLYTSIWCCLSE